MNEEIEFLKLNHISEIFKLPESNHYDPSILMDRVDSIYVPRIIYKDYIVSEFVKQTDLSGYLVSNINDHFLIDYITLLLNSGAFRYEHLKATSPAVSLNVTLSSLKNFIIPKIALTLQSKLSHISNQFILYKNNQSSENDRYFEVKASFFHMICDSMVFQLYHSDLFYENNIDLIGNIDILFPNNLFPDFEQMFKILSSESNALIDNAKAFTHYFLTLAEKQKNKSMNWRIDSLEIENFKFFKDTFIFNPQCKNILLYGENGSGKSSIYWSLFTIIQSVLKNPSISDARKYFDASNSQHLRNRYSNSDETSRLRMIFRDVDSNASKDCEDSLNIANATSPVLKDFMQKAFMASDFINYKFLSSLFEKRNSVDNEVFDIFNREIFPILSVIGGINDLDGNFIDSISFKEWWDYIQSIPPTLERNKKSKTSFKQNHPRYIAFQELINNFNKAVKTILQEIEIKTNRTLHDVYGLEIDIVLDYKACVFNQRIAPRRYDGHIHNPQIILKARLTSLNIPEINREILHPRSFFNEAKLTCMSIALRLAISDTKTNWPDSVKMLVLDDILVSLDMGNRVKVVDEIIKHSSRFQTFIFTHDRAFFHLVSAEIKKKGSIVDWKVFNLYEDPLVTTPYPKPVILEQNLSDSFDEAKRHYCNCDFAACLNSLRRYSERKLIEILPKHFSLEFTPTGETRHKMLGGLITAFSDFCCRFAMTNPCPNLEHYKDRLLNPFSHDNISSPIYRTEVKNLMNELAILDSVEKGIIDNIEKFSSHGYKLYHTSIPGISIEFDMLENFEWVKFNGCYYYSNSLVRITKATGIAINGEMLLYDLFQQIINGVSHPPSLAESIEIKPWHKTLNSISWH